MSYVNRSLEEFLELLKKYKIETLVDTRRFPISKIEHFKKERMENSNYLEKRKVKVIHIIKME